MTPRFLTSTNWTDLEVICEPYIVITFRGYTAAVEVLETETNKRNELFIGGIKSLAEGIEPIRQNNGGLFTGRRFKIKKADAARNSPYVIEIVNDSAAQRQTLVKTQAEEPELESPISTEDKLWQRLLHRHSP